MSEIILGIDPGIGKMGYAFLQKKSKTESILLEYGCITTPPNTPTYKRLQKLFKELTTIIKKYNPEIMVIEKLFFNSNTKTATMVGQAMGVILLSAAQLDLKIHEYTPLQVKTSLTGYGRAEKIQVQKMVRMHLNLKKKPSQDDAADAIAVALCYVLRKPELDAL